MKDIPLRPHRARAYRVLVAALFALTSATAALAHEPLRLSGAEEVPPVATQASGVARIHVGDDKTVTGVVETTGIEGTAAHIHLGERGKNGPPVITLVQGENGTWRVPEGSVLSDEHHAAYKQGHLYVNVHSAAHKPGEIRAQLKPE